MLTAKGTLNMTQDRELQEMLSYIGELSQEALQEMTLLIWQLRPEGLEKGLAEAIQNYGKLLGVQVEVRIDGMVSIGDEIEEVLWRISQGAIIVKVCWCEKVHILLKMKITSYILHRRQWNRIYTRTSKGISTWPEKYEGTYSVNEGVVSNYNRAEKGYKNRNSIADLKGE